MLESTSAKTAKNAPVRQDTLLSLLQAVLAQRDVTGVLRQLENSFGTITGFDRVNLLLPDPHAGRPCLHYRPGPGAGSASLEFVQLGDSPATQIFSTPKNLQCSGAAFRRNYPKSAGLFPYLGLSAYCMLPLQMNGQVLGGIEFIKSAEKSFNDDELLQLEQIAEVVAVAMDGILERAMLQAREEQTRKEREDFRVLVEVTNAALSKLEMNELAKEVSHAIRRYFGFDYVSLDVCDLSTQQLRTHSVLYQTSGESGFDSIEMPMNESLSGQVVMSQRKALLEQREIERTAGKYSQIRMLAQKGFQMILALPLISGDKARGALKLGHKKPYTFTQDKFDLLEQIAARLAMVFDNALAYQEISALKDKLTRENLYLSEEIRNYADFDEIVSVSLSMKTVLQQVEMVAASDVTVLILGETGTGKELIARAIHNLSTRSAHTMVKMNCAAVPSGLIESDLFGHEKGAYTGAQSQRIGRFELADKGTLFLDEVGDIPLDLQPKLLRVLQEREIERLGGSRVIPVDVRVIAATNCDLRQMVIERQYRSDLYYRLNVFPIILPPLRERPEDIPVLVRFFTQKHARRMNRHIESIPSDIIARLVQMPWPGNVRELENVIERAIILTRGTVLELPLNELQYQPAPSSWQPHAPSSPLASLAPPAVQSSRSAPLEDDGNDDDRVRILRVLRETNGIVAGPKGAAMRLGMKRTTLLSRMQRLGISAKNFDETDWCEQS
ncbi:MAG: formate hydrogenlyase transcriptional activator FlhA [Burkholderiaceae bacterium]|nr:formate hydrogenlyase transcriptional activator FlhA [Burkholderiaceae bacterium]